MKGLPVFLTMLLTATLLLAVLPTDAEAKIYEDTVRLHILAASDSYDDQALKLSLKDKILERYGTVLKEAGSRCEAERITKDLLSDIKKSAEEWIKDSGYDYTVSVTLTDEWYDTREYESFTLPKGYYTSLQIIIGKGEGKNWWCVMFPPLCLDAATSTTYSEEESLLITKRYSVKFKILEIFLFSLKLCISHF